MVFIAVGFSFLGGLITSAALCTETHRALVIAGACLAVAAKVAWWCWKLERGQYGHDQQR